MRLPSETENTYLIISTEKTVQKNPAVADNELLSCRLGKCSPRSSACQERTRAKARTRVTVIVARKSQRDNLFHLRLLETPEDAPTRSEPSHIWKGRYQSPQDVLEPLHPALGGLRKEDLVNAKPHTGENQVIFI